MSPLTPPLATTSSVQPGKEILDHAAAARQQAMRMAALRHALARNIRLRKRIALQHRDDGVEIRQRPRGQQAAHAGADHNGMLTNMFHCNAPALFRLQPAGSSLVRGNDRAGSDADGHKFVRGGLKPRSAFVRERAALRIDLAVFPCEWGPIMEAKFQIFLILLAVLAGTALLARRINIAPAILLLLAGIALAFVPGMPAVELPPELVLLVVLPPLIYSASVAMSWREFKSNLRPIILLAVGCVIFTAFAVAAATHYLIGLPWGVGFLLGAIVAPPDVVAPLAIARKLGMPRRILVVLEGEGLANDATALILYRFAVAAISTGLFSLPKATGTFAVIVVCEILFGVAVGWLSLRARHRARDPQVEITLSLITPYLAFWIPEHLGGSGVIATVACGLYMSWNGPLLISSATRLQGIFFWDLVIFLVEGLLFLLTGFQMRLLFEKSKAFPLQDILLTTALVAVIVIIARFAWVYPATYLPRLLSKRIA